MSSSTNVENPFFPSVQDFVHWSGGDHAIEKILIANNGIGATKAIRSIRKWAFETFGNERAIKFVVMATPEDMRANAEYIRLADQVVDVPGGSNNNNYANVNLICEIAERLKVDAVMPMWGHASENPSLPTNLKALKHRVTFIGPPAAPMQALGDKIGSTIIAQSAGVPTIAWNGDSLAVDYKNTGIPESVYDEANVKTAEEALACAQRIGFPVMIKASEGGGGKGIRKVHRSEDVEALFRQVQAEIPGSPVFVMKMASKARHLEVQLLADKHGEAIALSGRDCSVQRRHQKIIEEGPPTICSKDVFKHMEKAAVALAKTVGYENAGTVEYLYLDEDQSFAFLELNPRLQVEHPVTENILGVNLPACQLQVAMGLPLHRIADVRRLYGRHPRAVDTIDFAYAERVAPPRHCIAVRVTAENPEAGFQPSSGRIRELQFKSSIDVWGYFSVDNSGQIHEFADSQFGHIFAGGRDRESARRAMIVALKELQIRGEIRTTTEYIIKMLQAEDFINNHFDTDWLDGRLARHKEISLEENALYAPPPTLVATCGAALQGFRQLHARDEEFVQMLKIGQVPSRDALTPVVKVDLIFENVKYGTSCVQSGPERIVITCNNVSQQVNIRPLADNGYLMNVEGENHLVYAQDESDGSLRMVLDGHTCMFTPEYDPTRFVSSVAGKIARLLVADGEHVRAGEPFVEIEVMKMYMPLRMQESGVVHFQKSEGATLSPGDVIAKVTLDDPDKVVRAEEFKGILLPVSPALSSSASSAAAAEENAQNASAAAVAVLEDNFGRDLPHIKLREATHMLEKVLDGFPLSEGEIYDAFDKFVECKRHPSLPALKVDEILSVLRGRIDSDLSAAILALNNQYKESLAANNNGAVKYPAAKILGLLNAHLQSLPADKRNAVTAQTSDLWATVEPFVFSAEEVLLSAMVDVLEAFYNVEKLFDDMSFTDVVNQLRKEHSDDLNKVLQLCRSHANTKSKNVLILRVLDFIHASPSATYKRPELPAGVSIRNELNTRKMKVRLSDISKMRQSDYGHVSFAANLLIMDQFTLSTEVRRQRLHDVIVAALNTGDPVGFGERVDELKKFVDNNLMLRDLMIDSLRQDADYQQAVLELYVRRIYLKNHDLFNFASGASLSPDESDNNAWISFDFQTRSVEAFSDKHNALISQNISFSDLAHMSASQKRSVTDVVTASAAVTDFRQAVISRIESFDDLPRLFPHVVAKIVANDNSDNAEAMNAIHVILLHGPRGAKNDDEASALLSNFLSSQQKALNEKGVRRVTFFVGKEHDAHEFNANANSNSLVFVSAKAKTPFPSILTFRNRSGFAEDKPYRNLEPPHAFHLDLPRLRNFVINLEENAQTNFGNVHLYRAVPKVGKGPRRFFARMVSFSSEAANSDLESLFVEALDHLGIALGQEGALGNHTRAATKAQKSAANHFFINIVSPDSVLQPDLYEALLKKIVTKYAYKMAKLAVTTVELKLTARLSVNAEPLFLRIVATNPTGFVLKIDKYVEVRDTAQGETVLKSLAKNGKGALHGLPSQFPYEVSQQFEIQRAEAMGSSDTLYAYDWPELFESATERLWADAGLAHVRAQLSQEEVFVCRELVLCDAETSAPLPAGWTAKDALEKAVLLPLGRESGRNDCGMVAWHLTIYTPEYPEMGRELVLICNDITFQAGSFGTKEDALFFKASEYARVRGIPRIFLAANSGARIGMAQSLKAKFNICFLDERDPSKGYKYIYLNKEDYLALEEKYKNVPENMPVVCTPLSVSEEEVRYVITDIIGEESDLGVENLMGSGLIAGETAKAYNDIFTLTLVVGRSVGIGAYLIRLGQRTIQKMRHSPIILTGYQALNKLMGRDIYTTNDQLGGPMIMFPNGVSHMLAETHFDAVLRGLEWLSYVPAKRGEALPLRPLHPKLDSVERAVQFAPTKGVTYDPRLLLAGEQTSPHDHSWKSGFFDRGSFVEALGGWAKTVVVGRGRLGGIPMGVIVTENRTAETTKLADPADPTSQERLVQQAGGVWFPDSAYKTAQALRDFNREGLPCMILANWRGFSGGQRDMFDEVLKFGSMIVDALVAYQQPLFVYIPPFAELRGGAWVVVDSTINAEVMEFYAAEDARGGVLEAAGAASIKFRDREILETAHRLDPVLRQLDEQVKEAEKSGDAVHEDLTKRVKQRERALFGVYSQVAVHFADLHDTPGRMKAKGVIRKLVPWAESRRYFFWRLRRRLREFELFSSLQLKAADTAPLRKKFVSELQQWALGKGATQEIWEDDKALLEWLEANGVALSAFMDQRKSEVKAAALCEQLRQLSANESGAAVDALKNALSALSDEQKALLQKALL